MNLLEHESKSLLAQANIPTPTSTLIEKGATTIPHLPVVLKSQVPTGGRGKAGGILITDTPEDFELAVETLFNLPIKDFIPNTLLAEEKLDIKRELYLSLLIDRSSAGLKLLAHTQGGIEVEENHDFHSWEVPYNTTDFDQFGQELADYYDLSEQTFALQDLVQNLLTCLKRNDATMIEINPLVLTAQGKLIAGDAKITLDDAAAFRHGWQFETATAETNFVTIHPEGTVATIANGAGLAMATVDAAYDAGLIPANFLDIGGGANTESLLKAFNKIIEYPNVKAIILNVFAGITQADEVARAIVEAQKSISNLPQLFIRLTGTNSDQAKEILTQNHTAMLPNLESCLRAAKESIDV